MDPWGAPAAGAAAVTVGSAGPSPPPTVPAPAASGPWGPAPSTDPWGVASPTSPTSSDPWGGGAPPTIAPPPDPWGETSNRVNNVDPWGSSGTLLLSCSHVCPVGGGVSGGVPMTKYLKRSASRSVDKRGSEDLSTFTPLHSTAPFPVCVTDPVTLSVITSHSLTLSVCDEESKHAESIPPLCLNQGFLSSCFHSGLTVAVCQPKLSLLLPFFAFLIYGVVSYHLSFTST